MLIYIHILSKLIRTGQNLKQNSILYKKEFITHDVYMTTINDTKMTMADGRC